MTVEKEYLLEIKRIRCLRNNIILHSFVPLVVMAVSCALFLSFSEYEAFRYFQYGILAMALLVSAYSVTSFRCLGDKSGYMTRSALGCMVLSMLLFVPAYFMDFPFYLVSSAAVGYLLCVMALVYFSTISISIKVCYTVFLLIPLLYLVLPKEQATAIMAMSLIVFPMVMSYLAVKWAGKRFEDVNEIFNIDE